MHHSFLMHTSPLLSVNSISVPPMFEAATMMTGASSSQIHRHFHCRHLFLNGGLRYNFNFLTRSVSYSRPANAPSRSSISMCIEGTSKKSNGSEIRTTLTHSAGKAENSYPVAEEVGGNLGIDVPGPAEGAVPQKRAAKIHDFCFGIPFGGLVFSGGLVGFLFSRNPTTLITGVFFGGALLALSVTSLKVWGQGKSSLPFILGQSVLAAALLWKHFRSYSLTKRLFPTGFYIIVSAAMLVFYSYVMVSGGNPPPKKSKLAASPSS